MRRPNRGWLALATAVAIVVIPGCSSDKKKVTDIPADQAVEAGLDAALETTVVPAVMFFGAIADLLAAPPRAQAAALGGFVCPDTSGWCSSGTVACSVTGTGLAFDWDECMVVTGDDPLLLDGNIDAIPGNPISLTLTNLFINNNPAISGTGMIDTIACDYTVNVQSSGASVSGLVTACDSDPYPTGESLIVAFDDFVITILFDGSNIAQSTATLAGTPVVACTIDLDSEPLTSSCNLL